MEHPASISGLRAGRLHYLQEVQENNRPPPQMAKIAFNTTTSFRHRKSGPFSFFAV